MKANINVRLIKKNDSDASFVAGDLKRSELND